MRQNHLQEKMWNHTWIYCHPLFDERKFAHRFSYLLSRAFTEQGLRLHRFDYTGTGDDTGDFSNVTLDSLQRDLSVQCADQVTVNLIGLRLGATVAFNFYLNHPDRVNKLILLEPILDGQNYVDHLLRKQRIKDLLTASVPELESDLSEYINIEGFKANFLLIQQLRNIDLEQPTCQINHLPPFWERISVINYQPLIQKVFQYVLE